MNQIEKCVLSHYTPQRNGYAKMLVKGKNWLAHRYAYMKAHGPIPEGKLVLHKCDVRNCINVKHLYVGTHKDNSNNCWARDRHAYITKPWILPRGEAHHRAKLRNRDIRRIFKLKAKGVFLSELCKIYQISNSTLCFILKRRIWRHVKVKQD